MAWNRPIEVKATDMQRAKKPVRRMAVTFFAVISAIVLLWLLLSPNGTIQDKRKCVMTAEACSERSAPHNSVSEPRRFKAKGTVIVTTNVAPPVIEKADVFFEQKKGREITLRMPEGVIFTNSFNNFVAEVLTATPGSRFLEFDLDWMEDSFKESLKEQIVVLSDDSEEVAATKQAVQEAREQILKYVRDGGLVREIVGEARSELNKIADYRDQLQENLNKILTEGSDPQVALDYAAESNKLLEEYGAYPLDAPDNEEDALDIMASYKEAKIQEEESLDAEREKNKEGEQ